MAALINQEVKDAVAATPAPVEPETELIEDDDDTPLNLYIGMFRIDVNVVHEIEFTATDFVDAARIATEWTNHPNHAEYTLCGIVYSDAAQWEMNLQ